LILILSMMTFFCLVPSLKKSLMSLSSICGLNYFFCRATCLSWLTLFGPKAIWPAFIMVEMVL